MSEDDARIEIDLSEGDELDLACSSCNADLTGDELFRTLRICSRCRRHYWISARERLGFLLDPGSFQESNAELASIEPLQFRDRLPVADRLAEEREHSSIAEAVVTGTGTIAGMPAVVIALDLAIFGAGIGIVAGEKVALAMELAVTRRLPVIAICSAVSGRGREGVLALAQATKLTASAARLRRVGVPLIVLATHPTGGNAVLGLAHQADVCFAEPGAHVGLASGASLASQSRTMVAEILAETGVIDGVLDRGRQRSQFSTLLRVLGERGTPRSPAPFQPDESPPTGLLGRVVAELTELRGDRLGADHRGVRGGIGRVAGTAAVAIAVDLADPRLEAAAFAKANRLLRLAAHLEMPVVLLVERVTSEAEEEAATSLLMTQFLALLVAIPTPIVSVAIGELRGLAATTCLTADRVIMHERATVALPTGEQIATARECQRLGLVDSVLPTDGGEPAQLAGAIGAALAGLPGTGSRRLLDERTRRLRQIGLESVEGRAAAHVEWRELQEMQAAFGRSLAELRRRWEHRQLSLPPFAGRPSLPFTVRPAIPSISMPKLSMRRVDLADMANRVAAARRNPLARDTRERGEEAGEQDE